MTASTFLVDGGISGRLRHAALSTLDRVADGSHLAGVLGAETVEVPTYHHQGVATHPGYAATAWTADGVVEAFEDPQARFRLAVQWHPRGGRGLLAVPKSGRCGDDVVRIARHLVRKRSGVTPCTT
jgi:hypothetical protein